MGARLQSRLSLGQLRQLGRAAQALSQPQAGRLTANDLIRAGAQVNDFKIPLEVTLSLIHI